MSSGARQLPAELIQGACGVNVTGARSWSSGRSAVPGSFTLATPLQPMNHLAIEGALARMLGGSWQALSYDTEHFLVLTVK